jgi:lactoylglutathione lyase
VTQILGQFCINVRDIDRALEFWEGVCELELQHRTEIPGVLEAVLQSPHGGSRMQLAQHLERAEPIDMGTAMWKLYVNTSDCQAVYDRAIAAGCESVTEPTTLDRWPVIVAFVKDFDGYLIEFVEHKEGTREGVPDPKAVS